MAQLPMLVKAIYVDGWQIGKHPKRISTFEEFVEEVFQSSPYTFNNQEEAKKGIQAVLNVLKYHVSEGEFNDILAI